MVRLQSVHSGSGETFTVRTSAPSLRSTSIAFSMPRTWSGSAAASLV